MKRLLAALLLLSILALPALAEQSPSPAPAFYELRPGKVDPLVNRLKQRLYELGYYNNPQANSHYTDATADVMRLVQRVHGFEEDGIASPELLELLFSADAKPKPQTTPRPFVPPTPRPTATPKGMATPSPSPSPTPYMEPAFPLTLKDYATLARSGDDLRVEVAVENLSQLKDINAFSLIFYTRDAQGAPIRLDSGGLYTIHQYPLAVAPGATAEATDTTLSGYTGAASLYVALRSATLQDDTLLTVEDKDLLFFAWRLP